ncbi:fungal-specific transcription factor [Penicillium fimorum]|uniref:Fungal-specific transcription factor n=1 Tax=Penicillium fimorum TaxID=1882269 RepID=A0A9W9XQE0_9EURO|nr:fungal-specific transcription factor [Penicillium fimorum]
MALLWSQFGEDDVEQRHNSSKCLYILDQEICWTVGTSPSISLSEVHFGPSLVSAESRMTVFQAAKAEMAKIEETIYLAIYAPHVKPRTEGQLCVQLLLGPTKATPISSFSEIKKSPKCDNLELTDGVQ